ncbi:MAG: hypothetical protein Q8M40_04965 [Legionella sp.]|nr:hypothetical protein [Legionella sp.]
MHTLFDRTIKHKHEKKETYFANGREVSRHKCKSFIRHLIINEGEISVQKHVSFKLNDVEKVGHYFSLKLSCATLDLIKKSSKIKYEKLIHLVFTVLDSAVELQADVTNDNIRNYRDALSAFFDFFNAYRLNNESPLYKESLRMYSEITCDLLTYSLLAVRLSQSKKGIEYFLKYGEESIPKIIFPSLPQKENHLLDIHDSKNFVDNILNNITSMEKHISQEHFHPLAHALASEHLYKIYLKAKAYSEIFEEYLAKPTIANAPK